MFPAMLPPPTPFKLFALAAAVSEMKFTHFLLAIFAGRFVRFLVLAILTLRIRSAVRAHFRKRFPRALAMGAGSGGGGIGNLAGGSPAKEEKLARAPACESRTGDSRPRLSGEQAR